jgi:hypothetical protein
MGELGLALTLVIRLYDNGALGDRDRAVTVATASAILLAADIPTSWPDCASQNPGPGPKPRPAPAPVGVAACAYGMGSSDIAVRFQRTPGVERLRGDTPLGYAYVDSGRKEGALATIYLDRVDALAAATGVDRRVVLGRAIAHEVGHLLLGTNRHADSGLMRAIWSQRALRANRASDWLFGNEEREELVRALGRRVPGTAAAENSVWGTR